MDDSRRFVAALTLVVAFAGAVDSILAQTDESPRVARLVKTLGSDEFAARRAADRELLKLGPEGRQQLEDAASAADPEIRLRALNLLERIAVVRLWEPGRISLQVTDNKVDHVFAKLAEQTGNHVFVGEPFGEFVNVPVTVELQEKPYWQALDELAMLTGNHVRPHYDSRMAGVVIAAGAAGKYPTAYAGPVRAQITSARRVFIEEFDYEQPASDVTHTFQLNLQMMWEDRFRLAAYGAQPEVVEAITDTGVAVAGPPATSSGWNIASSSTRQVTASLKLNPPPASAKQLSVLRLKWSLVALGEMANADIESPATGSELHRDGLTLKVIAFERQPTGRVELTLLASRNLAVPDPPDVLFQENVIELLDPQGKPFRQQSQNHSLTDRGVEFRLAFLGENASMAPARLRFTYPKLRSRRDLEIVFRDVPLPVERPE